MMINIACMACKNFSEIAVAQHMPCAGGLGPPQRVSANWVGLRLIPDLLQVLDRGGTDLPYLLHCTHGMCSQRAANQDASLTQFGSWHSDCIPYAPALTILLYCRRCRADQYKLCEHDAVQRVWRQYG